MATTINPMKNIVSNSIGSAKVSSSYSLLVRSEETRRNIFEVLVYAIFIVCAVFSIWQFAHQSVVFPNAKTISGKTIENHLDSQRG